MSYTSIIKNYILISYRHINILRHLYNQIYSFDYILYIYISSIFVTIFLHYYFQHIFYSSHTIHRAPPKTIESPSSAYSNRIWINHSFTHGQGRQSLSKASSALPHCTVIHLQIKLIS